MLPVSLSWGEKREPALHPRHATIPLQNFSEPLLLHHLVVVLGCSPGGSFTAGAVADPQCEVL